MATKYSHGNNIGVLVDPIGAYGRGVTRGIISYQRYRQWKLSLLRAWIFEPMSMLEGWSGQGLIAMAPDEEAASRITQTGKPAVWVSSLLPQLNPMSVVADDFAVGAMAGKYFMNKGYNHFMYCGYSDRESSSLPWFISRRLEGFVDSLKDSGHLVIEVLQRRQLSSAIRSSALPLAVFAANDEIGIEVINIAEKAGLRVPENVAVLGVDNDDLLVESCSAGLSSIELPTFAIGFQAASSLDELLSGHIPALLPRALPPVRVVTRQSSDITAIEDSRVTCALAFIRKHYVDPISISDVVREVPLSRRALERHFQKYLKHSVLSEIHRLRLERADQLLLTTDLPIEQIALASGFTSRSRFYAVFFKAHKCTPAEYRRHFQLA